MKYKVKQDVELVKSNEYSIYSEGRDKTGLIAFVISKYNKNAKIFECYDEIRGSIFCIVNRYKRNITNDWIDMLKEDGYIECDECVWDEEEQIEDCVSHILNLIYIPFEDDGYVDTPSNTYEYLRDKIPELVKEEIDNLLCILYDIAKYEFVTKNCDEYI